MSADEKAMPTLTIDGCAITVEPGTLLIEACRVAGVEVPHFCYHPCLKATATCRMCVVEVKGQAKLVASCSAPAAEGMEVRTDSPAVAEARAGVMEFLLLNHPLDCPICDRAGECRLQDYSYKYGSDTGRMEEQKRHYDYEDLGAKIVIDKNRCVHCTRCVRFTRDITGTCELSATSRGAHLEITTYEGRSLDANPFAGNLADVCPVGALTSRDFRFKKRTWYLKPIPTISRHGADAKTIWVDVDQNMVWRVRPRAEGDNSPLRFISDDERQAWQRYSPAPQRPTTPMLNKQATATQEITRLLRTDSDIAVAAQGTFGNTALQALKKLASNGQLLFAHGNKKVPIQNATIQRSDDGVINRKGALATGYRFGALQELLSKVEAGAVKAIVLYHDSDFSDDEENALLKRIVERVVFSLVIEPVPSHLSETATATLPVTTYLEETDFITDHQGVTKHYIKALEPPVGVKTPAEWVKALMLATSK